MAGGPAGRPALPRPIDTLILIQGAFSLWSYAPEIPTAPGRAGYFHPILRDGRVSGPIVTTQSEHDLAVGRLYPLAAGVRRQVDYADQLPKYGAVGTFGLCGLDDRAEFGALGSTTDSYAFEPGRVYNLESSGTICQYLHKMGGATATSSTPRWATRSGRRSWPGRTPAEEGERGGGDRVHSIGQMPWARSSLSLRMRRSGPSSLGRSSARTLEQRAGTLVGGLEVVAGDHGGFEVVPIVGPFPGFPTDEGMAGDEDDRRLERRGLEQAGHQHGAVDAVGALVAEGLARQARSLRDLTGAGAEVDHGVDITDARLLERLEQRTDLCGGGLRVRPPLIAGDPAIGHPIGRASDQGLHRLDVGSDPCTVIASQVPPHARLGVLDRVEARVARQEDDAVVSCDSTRLDQVSCASAGSWSSRRSRRRRGASRAGSR